MINGDLGDLLDGTFLWDLGWDFNENVHGHSVMIDVIVVPVEFYQMAIQLGVIRRQLNISKLMVLQSLYRQEKYHESCLLSGNQTCLAGKWTIKIHEFPRTETSIQFRDFPAMFDDTGG